MLHTLQSGFGFTTAALTINREALGVFFSISGYHKLFNAKRHATLAAELEALGIPAVAVMQWFVPSVEFLGGLSLLSGILSPFAALGLIAVCLVATCTAGLRRIPSMRPIDRADWLDDLLYLPESLYIIGLIIVASNPGAVL